MSLGTVLLIILILILLGVLPTWPHARSWGYGPTGIVGVVLVVVIVLFLLGRLLIPRGDGGVFHSKENA